jgi:hypothetical protein
MAPHLRHIPIYLRDAVAKLVPGKDCSVEVYEFIRSSYSGLCIHAFDYDQGTVSAETFSAVRDIFIELLQFYGVVE